jgi:hypothetical protein
LQGQATWLNHGTSKRQRKEAHMSHDTLTLIIIGLVAVNVFILLALYA